LLIPELKASCPIKINSGMVVRSYKAKTSYTFLDRRLKPAWGVTITLNPTKPTLAIIKATSILVRNMAIIITISIIPVIIRLILFLGVVSKKNNLL
jgi:hypothetical protein